MKLRILTPNDALNDSLKKHRIERAPFEKFKENLRQLLYQTDSGQFEDFNKNSLIRFLDNTYYSSNHYINIKGRTDLVIHHGKNAKSRVGVIIEAKRPEEKKDMLSITNINVKALHEMILYFLRERITGKNLDIKHLIATDFYQWFVFDVQVFDKLFADNNKFVNRFKEFEARKLSSVRTQSFYDEIAAPYVADLTQEIRLTHFDLRDYRELLDSTDPEDEAKLSTLYKVLSPMHLLQQSVANDSNTLNKDFYDELLHIIGLKQVTQGSKKLIQRKEVGERNRGSLLENAIDQLESLDKINYLPNPEKYGKSNDERLFNVGLELCITWMNRILFLKLMEAQLVKYNGRDKDYEFLSIRKIPFFGVLNRLFFNVLAKKNKDRDESLQKEFGHVPYLNSSLFEINEVERESLVISNLSNDRSLPLHSKTVLRDDRDKVQTGEKGTLEYLLEFLRAYDFSSDGSEKIQKDKKGLISASVLGLIFEKINGYKDGSYFTPGFITEYMCRETIQKAILQKFKDAKGWDYDNIKDLGNKIEPADIEESNKIVNSLKICDPAVGSGHFLVSALNEIIAIKQKLGILTDKNGNRLHHYGIKVVDDELMITDSDEKQYEKLFKYKPGNPESQRLQEALFHEKQTIIENCLFGVDINPNSVKICRLRLWIELLKNAYYKQNLTGLRELETLPNIDINIKCGNSLVSRFALDTDLKQIARSAKWNVFSYRNAVEAYKKSPDREVKRELEKLIHNVKSNYVETIQRRNPKLQKYYSLRQEYDYKFPENGLFAHEPEVGYGENAEQIENEKQRLISEIEKIQLEIEAEKIFFERNNAFEWRFEFPEVLNEDGDFMGFDIVLSNPPYISTKNIVSSQKKYFLNRYQVAKGQFDLYLIFTELASTLLKINGHFSFITSNTFISNKDCDLFRRFLLQKVDLLEIVNLDETVFTEAKLDVAVFSYKNRKPEKEHQFLIARNRNEFENNTRISFKSIKALKNASYQIKINYNNKDWAICEKIEKCSNLSKYVEITRGIEFGGNSELIQKNKFKNSLPIIAGNSISKYTIKNSIGFAEHDTGKLSVYKPIKFYQAPRILIQRIRNLTLKDRIVATYTREEILCTNTLRILTLKKRTKIDLKYLLAILNSKLINYYFRLNFNNKDIYAYQLEQIPICFDSSRKNEIINIVNQIIKAKKQNPKSITTTLESQIDHLVYQLYGLTEEEIKIVEESV